MPDHYQLADVTAPAVTPAGCDARVPSDSHVDSHEELRRKIATFNDNSHGSIMSLVSYLSLDLLPTVDESALLL